MIAENLIAVRERLADVCQRCGRRPEEVQLVAVSKTFTADLIRQAIAAGQRDFGENYVQEWQEKHEALAGEALRWHFIGHLQANKAKFLVGRVHLIHAVHDLRLIEELQKRAERSDTAVDVLIEVHTTDEATKFGVTPAQTLELVKHGSQHRRVRIRGLMTMGPFADDPNDSRPSFQQLRSLQQRIAGEGIENVMMEHLSMGMTHDMDVAVEEGATIVRIGTAIFGKRRKREAI
jgi:hypothetical protein